MAPAKSVEREREPDISGSIRSLSQAATVSIMEASARLVSLWLRLFLSLVF